ncbi:ATP-binding cassette subfamily B protein [Hasllibacter halocynthiae]|uniref:ATP-binding cassette subfamily B protein n=1 Tax=Hasllibacter halocynthiae TaxID=595589 RepID=A0A2T0X267_9RHOB|nr:ABC transporter ATP-binding protein [Hasllibacter halocynthiae]PRY93046.1 ATP-binding cassette subfamily B protein [Hasllibacter halocynthiae]
MQLSDIIDPEVPASGPPPRTLWAFARWCLAGGGLALGIAGALSVTAGVFEVLTALLLGWIIDAALASGPSELWAGTMPLLLAAAAFLVILRPAVTGASAIMQAVVLQPNIQNQVLTRLHRWTMGQAVTFFDEDFAGRIAQKQMQTANAVTSVTVDVINTGLFALASIVGAAIMVAGIDARAGAAMALWVVAYLGLMAFFLPRIRVRAKDRAGKRAAVTGQVVDTVTNIKTVKLFAHSEHEDRAALDAMGRFRGAALRFGRLSAAFRVSLFALAGLLPVILVGMMLYYWSTGAATAGAIVSAGAISIRLAQMSGWVSFTFMGVYSYIGEIEDGMRTLSPRPTLVDAEGAADLAVDGGRIELDDVSFTYGREGGQGLHGVSLTVRPGEKVGIVGASGAGKSTLVNLVLRMHDVQGGAIRIDGQDVARVTQDSLRRAIALVTQETAMFNRSARDNIAYGDPGASDEAVVAAAKAAEAHEFILALRDREGREGYDAFLGERGVRLSGGQRQRIALARAILKDAPILVLDEATSALDSEVEASIQAALGRVMEGKTVLAIAHRLSTLTEMDRIVVLDEGRVVEEGTHAALLARGGLYARYWDRQSGGFRDRREAAE